MTFQPAAASRGAAAADHAPCGPAPTAVSSAIFPHNGRLDTHGFSSSRCVSGLPTDLPRGRDRQVRGAGNATCPADNYTGQHGGFTTGPPLGATRR